MRNLPRSSPVRFDLCTVGDGDEMLQLVRLALAPRRVRPKLRPVPGAHAHPGAQDPITTAHIPLFQDAHETLGSNS